MVSKLILETLITKGDQYDNVNFNKIAWANITTPNPDVRSKLNNSGFHWWWDKVEKSTNAKEWYVNNADDFLKVMLDTIIKKGYQQVLSIDEMFKKSYFVVPTANGTKIQALVILSDDEAKIGKRKEHKKQYFYAINHLFRITYRDFLTENIDRYVTDKVKNFNTLYYFQEVDRIKNKKQALINLFEQKRTELPVTKNKDYQAFKKENKFFTQSMNDHFKASYEKLFELEKEGLLNGTFTVASSALLFYKKHFKDEHAKIINLDQEQDEYIRASYAKPIAFVNNETRYQLIRHVHEMDYSSMYTTMMLEPVPVGGLTFISNRGGINGDKIDQLIKDGRPGFVRVNFRYDHLKHKGHNPFNLKDGINTIPTILFNELDIWYEYNTLQYLDAYFFERVEPVLKSYVELINDRRYHAESKDVDQYYKLLGNSLYGKFGRKTTFRPSIAVEKEGEIVFKKDEVIEAKPLNVAISSWIITLANIEMAKNIKTFLDNGNKILRVMTDAITVVEAETKYEVHTDKYGIKYTTSNPRIPESIMQELNGPKTPGKMHYVNKKGVEIRDFNVYINSYNSIDYIHPRLNESLAFVQPGYSENYSSKIYKVGDRTVTYEYKQIRFINGKFVEVIRRFKIERNKTYSEFRQEDYKDTIVGA